MSSKCVEPLTLNAQNGVPLQPLARHSLWFARAESSIVVPCRPFWAILSWAAFSSWLHSQKVFTLKSL